MPPIKQDNNQPFGLIEYGAMLQKVQYMDKRMSDMEADIKLLLELANKSKGGFWFGMTVVSGISALVGFLLSFWRGQH